MGNAKIKLKSEEMRHYHHHHHRRRRRHRRHHIHRPLVDTINYCPCVVRYTHALGPPSPCPAGAWGSTIGVVWQQSAESFGYPNLYGFGSADPESRFRKVFKEWEQFRITGLRIQFDPVQFNSNEPSNNGATILTGIWSFDKTSIQPPNNLDFNNNIQRADTREHPVNRRWHLYKNARPYSAAQNVKWQDCTVATGLNGLTDACTYISVRGYPDYGIGQGDPARPMMYITFSWYI